MKKTLIEILILFLFVITKSVAQEHSKIEYLTPEKVKIEISKYLKEDLKVKPNTSYYVIWDTEADTTYLLICRYDDKYKPLSNLVNSTNRHLCLSKEISLPIIVIPDLLFSTELHFLSVEKGKIAIEDRILQNSGYSIVFTGTYGKETVIRAEYYQN